MVTVLRNGYIKKLLEIATWVIINFFFFFFYQKQLVAVGDGEVEVDNMKKCNWVTGMRHAKSKGSSRNRSLSLEDRDTFSKFNMLMPFRLYVLNKCSPVF